MGLPKAQGGHGGNGRPPFNHLTLMPRPSTQPHQSLAPRTSIRPEHEPENPGTGTPTPSDYPGFSAFRTPYPSSSSSKTSHFVLFFFALPL